MNKKNSFIAKQYKVNFLLFAILLKTYNLRIKHNPLIFY